jgi:hypothetical protein
MGTHPHQVAAFIGGKDFDPVAVSALLSDLNPQEVVVVVGEGQGLEKWIYEQAPEFGLQVRRIERPKDSGFSMDVNVEQVFVETLWRVGEAPPPALYLAGHGTRVKRMEMILKRANWPLEVTRV